MEKINVAELIKDCPKGMELDCTICNNVVTLEGVDKEGNYPIRVVSKSGFHHILTCEGYVYEEEDAKCVIFPKGKTTWEGFQRPFKDGDIVVTKTFNNFIFYSIYKGVENRKVLTYADYTPDDNGLIVNHTLCYSCEIIEQRLAIEEEKQKLFDAIKANGYKWNEETKTLEKLLKFKVGDRIKEKRKGVCGEVLNVYKNKYNVKIGDKELYLYFREQDDWELIPNKFDITTLNPFDKVLVRDKDTDTWEAHLFSRYYKNSDTPYICIGVEGINEFKQCIPYDSNKELLGTTDNCDEYYKTWE